ncbi:MAG: GAF domain-containing sensor histidine kinase [Anaerolineae bacterium]|nr:GAF domain-containing sensor histidine kinase [Anaerolineae bacterium]
MTDRERALQQQIDHLMAMLEISRILNSTLDHRHLQRIIVNSAVKLTDCEDSSIILVDAKSGELHFSISAGLQDSKIQPLVVPVDSSIAGWIVRNNKPVIIDDVNADTRFFRQIDQSTGFPTRSIMGVPMSFRGRVLGVVEAVNKRNGTFTDEDTERLTILAAQAAVAIQNTRLMNELQTAYEELSELDRLKSEFITTTSHELRTPLTAIKGYLQLVNSGIMSPEQQQSALEKISDNVDTIVHLVNDLLFMQEMNAIEFKFSATDLAELVRAEVRAAAPRAGAQGTEIALHIADDLPLVWGDATHLIKMIHNLLDNAIKFSPDGGSIIISLQAQNNSIYLQVTDQGIGIPADKLDKIFDRFYRIESSSKHLFGGLGLGLAIAKHIAETHKGKIGVVSQAGQGSTFTVTLPAHESQVTFTPT